MRLEPLGDSAWLIRVEDGFDPENSLGAVVGRLRQLEAASIPGVIDLVPSFTTIGVFVDQERAADFDALKARIEAALEPEPVPADSPARGELEIPVCYDREFGLDLDEVARHTELSTDEIIDRHSAAIYRVAAVGFTLGFPYLSGLPPELATPRRSSPRTEIPAGSVAIGGTQTGIYPRKSPGGWNIIGRTPLPLFEIQRDPPALLKIGDSVRLRPISREEFERISR
jgi:inhibitor of KinA